MGAFQSSTQTSVSTPVNDKRQTDETKPKCKPCCACPETKRVRDECVILNGEENCAKEIEAHRACMREAGFNI